MNEGACVRLTEAEIRTLDLELDAAARPPHPASCLKLGVSSAGGVAVAGSDGFLFIGDGANRWESQYLRQEPVPEAWIAGWRNIFAARQAEAAARGVALWNLVIPEKQVIYPERRWPVDTPNGKARPLKQLLPRLGPEARLAYPDAALLACKEEAPACSRHNSHWSASGCCSVLRSLLSMSAPLVDPAAVVFSASRRMAAQDLTRHFFDPPHVEDGLWLVEAGERAFDNQQIAKTGRHAGSSYGVRNPAAPDTRSVILFGDSYSYDEGFAGALSAVFAEVTFVWSKSVVWDLVAQFDADLVIWESAERFLATLPEV